MDCFPLLRPLLHRLDPETAHALAIGALKREVLPGGRIGSYPNLRTAVWGIDVDNPIGLAAGFDKNAECIPALSRQGFGFIEVGTATPRPQEGNPRPRIFRLPEDRAVINRLGFNNLGMAVFSQQLERAKLHAVPVGANIGRNADTEDAIQDYVKLLGAVYPHCAYVTVNISSPNTKGLRGMQEKSPLAALLLALREKREEMQRYGYARLPLVIKIAPDLTAPEMDDIADVALASSVDGLIVSNTTTQRPPSLRGAARAETGGLSGAPLFDRSTQVLREMYARVGGHLPLIGVGGVGSGEDAYAKIRAGASLVQLYTALIYEGFGLVERIKRDLSALLERDGFASIRDAVGSEG